VTDRQAVRQAERLAGQKDAATDGQIICLPSRPKKAATGLMEARRDSMLR